MYKQADVTSGHTTIPELQNDVTSPNALPTAAMLAAIGGVAGLGGSLLSKKQRKHKLRNTLLGATALPALFLAADKWGTDKMRNATHTIKSRVNHDLLPPNMVSFFGGWNEHDIGNAPTIRNAYDTTRGRLSDKEDELQQVKNTPVHASSEDYRKNEQDIKDYSEGGKQVNQAKSDFTAQEEAINNRKIEADTQREAARKKVEREHAAKVEAAQKQLQQLKDQEYIDALTRYETAHPEIKDNPEWVTYKKLYAGKESAVDRAKASFGDTDKALLKSKRNDLGLYNNALTALKENREAENPYKAEVEAAKQKVLALTSQINNFKNSDEYKDIARREELRVLGTNLATAYTDQNQLNKDIQNAIRGAVSKREKELKQDLDTAKQNLANTQGEYNKAGWDKFWGSWSSGRKQRELESRIADITAEIQGLQEKENAANSASAKADTDFNSLLRKYRLAGHNDSLNEFLGAHEKAKTKQQNIIDSKVDYGNIDDEYGAAKENAEMDLISAQVARDQTLANIATKLKQFQDQKSTWDTEDLERQKRFEDLVEEVNSTIPATLKQDADNYDYALENNRQNIARTQNQLLAATGGGAGLIVLLSALNKLRKRKKKEISPEEYLNYLEEEGMA